MPPRRRQPLDRERIVDAAVAVADDAGLAGVSMRTVGRRLGVEAMSLYHHLEGKDDLLDAMADWVFAAIELPELDTPWRRAMHERASSLRRVLAAHPWALGLLESRRTPGPALLTHHDAVIGSMRRDGFSVALAAHAFSLLDAYVYGFVLTEVNLPFAEGEDATAFVESIDDLLPADRYPYLVELIGAQVGSGSYDYGDEFPVGLELILDALERQLAGDRDGTGSAVAEADVTTPRSRRRSR